MAALAKLIGHPWLAWIVISQVNRVAFCVPRCRLLWLMSIEILRSTTTFKIWLISTRLEEVMACRLTHWEGELLLHVASGEVHPTKQIFE